MLTLLFTRFFTYSKNDLPSAFSVPGTVPETHGGENREFPALVGCTGWWSWQVMNTQKWNNYPLWQSCEDHGQGNLAESQWEREWVGGFPHGLGGKQGLSGTWVLKGGKGSSESHGKNPLSVGRPGFSWALPCLAGCLCFHKSPTHSGQFPHQRSKSSSRSYLSVNLNNYKSLNWRLIALCETTLQTGKNIIFTPLVFISK